MATREWVEKHKLLTTIAVIVVLAVIGNIAQSQSSPAAPPAQTPSTDAAVISPTPTVATSSAPQPQTMQEKLDAMVRAQLQQGSVVGASYKQTQIENDDDGSGYARPAGTKYLTIDVSTGPIPDDTRYIEGTGQLTTGLFQQTFTIDPSVYDVLVRYYGKTTDPYGNTKTDMLMSYEMDRPLYSKMNWAGLPRVQNDLHMCAFLREESMTMTETARSISYVSCVILPYDLTAAEDAIESGSPQYNDIPRYRTK
jgi:hypothetical protein